MKMFHTEHDFQVDLENFEFNLKFYAEGIQHSITGQQLVFIGNLSTYRS